MTKEEFDAGCKLAFKNAGMYQQPTLYMGARMMKAFLDMLTPKDVSQTPLGMLTKDLPIKKPQVWVF
jgi:hypothetical protein